MKKGIFLIGMVVCMCLSASAQTQNVENDPIYSDGGFEWRTSVVKGKYYDYETTSLYSSDGKTLVAVMYYDDAAYLSALPQTERIAPNALRAMSSADSNYRICIPSSVKYVYPTSFITSKANNPMAIVIVTDEISETTTAVKEIADNPGESEAHEAGRYNIQGMRIDEPEAGINIVRMSDNTSKKVLVK